MWCRLCLKYNSFEILKIFDGEGVRLKIADVISQHFWFTPKKDDGISDIICIECWNNIDHFHKFYVYVEEAQKNLSKVSIKPDPSATLIGSLSSSYVLQQTNKSNESFKTENQRGEWLNEAEDEHTHYSDVLPVTEEGINNVKEIQFDESETENESRYNIYVPDIDDNDEIEINKYSDDNKNEIINNDLDNANNIDMDENLQNNSLNKKIQKKKEIRKNINKKAN